eukprot:11197411-Lingulodinium_polyedra.AAC.1
MSRTDRTMLLAAPSASTTKEKYHLRVLSAWTESIEFRSNISGSATSIRARRPAGTGSSIAT